MKKISIVVSVILFSLLLAGVFGACSGGQHTVTFDFNYEGAPAATAVKVDDNTFVDEPDDPVRDNWTFLGWFTDPECTNEAELDRTITGDVTFYAGWKRSRISVTFDLNYAGGGTYGEVQHITVGAVPTRPANPTRTDYLFRDWYTVGEAAQQNETNRYKFTALSEDTVIYAGWDEKGESTAVVKFMWNFDGAPDEGVYGELQVNVGSKISAPVPQREAGKYRTYSLSGWRDEAGAVYNADQTFEITADTTLYALWNVKNTFEAEFTDMSYFQGAGWSWNPTGTGGIQFDKNNQSGSNAVNNAFVGNMNSKGTFIYFQINSDKAVTGLTLKLRLSIEAYFSEMLLTPAIYSVSTATSFDGERTPLDYEPIHIDGVIGKDIAEFKDYFLTTKLNLAAGMNYIFVQSSANFAEAGYPELAGNMGAMSAFAPVIDSLIIEHDEGSANLDWTPRVCNLWNYGYDEADYPCDCDRHKH